MQSEEYRHNVKTPYHISCGGAVFRQVGDRTEVLLLIRHEDDRTSTYHLPKGTLHHHETLEDCALREIREESGHDGIIVGYLGGFTQNFVQMGLAVDKTILYFAVKWRKEVGAHDVEHDEVKWEEVATARTLLENTEPRKEEYIILDRLETFLAV